MKNIIIWVEDRPDTVYNQVLLCRQMGFDIKLVSTVHRFVEILKKEKENVALIIMDIMLFTVISLDSVGIPDSFTDSGYRAGWVIIDRLLRPREIPAGIDDYKEIPILILTTQRLFTEDSNQLRILRKRGGAWLKYLEKNAIGKVEGEMDGKTANWTEHFKVIITKLEIDHVTLRSDL
jgi:CheY-like chemotaxis protein